MIKSLALTIIGPDRPGLVSQVSETAARHGANWLDSHLVNLAGQFAGIVHFHVPDSEIDTLVEDFRELEASGLTLSHAIGNIDESNDAQAGWHALMLELTGPDYPGIVQNISEALTAKGVSIDTFDSRSFSASMSGEAMFEARARLQVPPDVQEDTLHAALEELSDSLMVDISLEDEAQAVESA